MREEKKKWLSHRFAAVWEGDLAWGIQEI